MKNVQIDTENDKKLKNFKFSMFLFAFVEILTDFEDRKCKKGQQRRKLVAR